MKSEQQNRSEKKTLYQSLGKQSYMFYSSAFFSRCSSPTDQQYDQKNIRRRVYDALNVLMAMNIISKEKKEIKWLGLPTNSVQEANGLEIDKTRRIERIKAKTQQLQDLILQVRYHCDRVFKRICRPISLGK